MTYFIQQKNGFSLVELSIVLVILGLLTGGILTGQSLIKAAELRASGSEFSAYQTAVQLFKQKYFSLPGDMSNATAFWNSNANCAATVTDINPTTCNGNGNGVINDASGGTRVGELFLFWQHLALAGLIEGNYTGTSGSGGSHHHRIGINAPDSRFTNAGWGVDYYTTNPDNAKFFDVSYGGNVWEFGTSSATGDMDNAALTPEEAWNIDSKLDDGKPAKGNIIAIFWNNACADASANTDIEAGYFLENTDKDCALLFKNAY